MVFGWKADGMLTLTGGTYLHFMNLHGGEGVGERVTFTHASVFYRILLLRFWSVLRTARTARRRRKRKQTPHNPLNTVLY